MTRTLPESQFTLVLVQEWDVVAYIPGRYFDATEVVQTLFQDITGGCDKHSSHCVLVMT